MSLLPEGIDLEAVELPVERYARIREEQELEREWDDELDRTFHRMIRRELGNERYWEDD